MEFIPGEEAVKIIELIAKNLEYYINSVDELAVDFKKTNSIFERSSTVGKILSKNILCYREVIHKRKS